jgi:hypothetical protein
MPQPASPRFCRATRALKAVLVVFSAEEEWTAMMPDMLTPHLSPSFGLPEYKKECPVVGRIRSAQRPNLSQIAVKSPWKMAAPAAVPALGHGDGKNAPIHLVLLKLPASPVEEREPDLLFHGMGVESDEKKREKNTNSEPYRVCRIISSS